MNNGQSIVCVLRHVGKNTQWVLAEGRHDLKPGEATLSGSFSRFSVRSGPSGSHVVSCYTPIGRNVHGKLGSTGRVDDDSLGETVAPHIAAASLLAQTPDSLRQVG